MKRYTSLLRNTWWMWLLILTAVVVLGILENPLIFLFTPVCAGVFIYFALLRYDEDGKPKD